MILSQYLGSCHSFLLYFSYNVAGFVFSFNCFDFKTEEVGVNLFMFHVGFYKKKMCGKVAVVTSVCSITVHASMVYPADQCLHLET